MSFKPLIEVVVGLVIRGVIETDHNLVFSYRRVEGHQGTTYVQAN